MRATVLVGDHAGVADPGQLSKLLRRLERLGLTVNTGGGHQSGEPNAWISPRSAGRSRSVSAPSRTTRQRSCVIRPATSRIAERAGRCRLPRQRFASERRLRDRTRLAAQVQHNTTKRGVLCPLHSPGGDMTMFQRVRKHLPHPQHLHSPDRPRLRPHRSLLRRDRRLRDRARLRWHLRASVAKSKAKPKSTRGPAGPRARVAPLALREPRARPAPQAPAVHGTAGRRWRQRAPTANPVKKARPARPARRRDEQSLHRLGMQRRRL